MLGTFLNLKFLHFHLSENSGVSAEQLTNVVQAYEAQLKLKCVVISMQTVLIKMMDSDAFVKVDTLQEITLKQEVSSSATVSCTCITHFHQIKTQLE